MSDLDTEWSRVKAEYDAAFDAQAALLGERETATYVGSDAWHAAKRRFDSASAAVVATRTFWRKVGAAVPDSHPGSRPSDEGFGIKTVDNNIEFGQPGSDSEAQV